MKAEVRVYLWYESLVVFRPFVSTSSLTIAKNALKEEINLQFRKKWRAMQL
jgi:hypothetical protein